MAQFWINFALISLLALQGKVQKGTAQECIGTDSRFFKFTKTQNNYHSSCGFDYFDFSSFEQLDLNCDIIPHKNSNDILYFNFEPKDMVLIERPINMSLLNTEHDVFFETRFKIIVFNIKGFDLKVKPFMLIDNNFENEFNIYLDQMRFDFYLNWHWSWWWRTAVMPRFWSPIILVLSPISGMPV